MPLGLDDFLSVIEILSSEDSRVSKIPPIFADQYLRSRLLSRIFGIRGVNIEGTNIVLQKSLASPRGYTRIRGKGWGFFELFPEYVPEEALEKIASRINHSQEVK